MLRRRQSDKEFSVNPKFPVGQPVWDYYTENAYCVADAKVVNGEWIYKLYNPTLMAFKAVSCRREGDLTPARWFRPAVDIVEGGKSGVLPNRHLLDLVRTTL